MNSLEAQIRTDITKGELNALRLNGNVPAIVYGVKEENVKISIRKMVKCGLVTNIKTGAACNSSYGLEKLEL